MSGGPLCRAFPFVVMTLGGGHSPRWAFIGSPDVETLARRPARDGIGVDEMAMPPGLVGGQGIHRVELRNRLDPLRPWLCCWRASARRIGSQEALGFAEAGAGATRCCGVCGKQPIEGLLLVAVGGKGRGNVGKPVA